MPCTYAGTALSDVYDSGGLGNPKGILKPRLDTVSGSVEQFERTVPLVSGSVLYSDVGLI
jgi:hypothetical protein